MSLEKDDHKFRLQIQGDPNRTMQLLNTQRRTRMLCDISLIVDGEEFPAHRGVLAANSQFFQALFTTEMLEKDTRKACLACISADAMESILEFMYTGQLQIHSENVFELLEASNYLFVEKVKEACCQFLKNIVDLENCFTILSISDTFSCDNLKQMVTKYIHQNFTELAKTEAFLKLDQKDVVKFLSSDDIQIDNEEQILEITVNWLNYDLEPRKFDLKELLRLIRWPFIASPLVQVRVGQLKEFSQSAMKEVLLCHQKTGNITARKFCSSVNVIAVTGGCNSSAILDAVTCFIPAENKWTLLSKMNVPRRRHQMVSSEEKPFAIGGLRDVCVRDSVKPFVEMFCGQRNSWVPVPHQLAVCDEEIDSFCAVSTGSNVLLVGGVDPKTNSCSSRVYSFELRDNSSSVASLSSMLCPRAGHCLVTSGDNAYAIGGFGIPYTPDSRDGMRSVECYDMAKDVWTSVQPMHEIRLFAAAVVINGKIFIFGGCDGQNVLRSCEVYDIKLDTWQHITPMQISRMKHSAVVHAGKVYIIGGASDSRAGPGLRSVECYIPEEDRWTRISDMPIGRFHHQSHVCDIGYKFVAHTMEKAS